jgi:hypothetical protein
MFLVQLLNCSLAARSCAGRMAPCGLLSVPGLSPGHLMLDSLVANVPGSWFSDPI